jgi:hypothetical protein
MSEKRNIEIAIDVGLSLVVLAYLLAQSPTSMVYLRNWLVGVRWWVWNSTHAEWLKEALLVRGKM